MNSKINFQGKSYFFTIPLPSCRLNASFRFDRVPNAVSGQVDGTIKRDGGDGGITCKSETTDTHTSLDVRAIDWTI